MKHRPSYPSPITPCPSPITHRLLPVCYIHKLTPPLFLPSKKRGLRGVFLRAALLLLLTFITFASLILLPSFPLYQEGTKGCVERGLTGVLGDWGFSGTAYAQSWDELATSATGGGVSNNAGNSWSPSLALDSSGRPHIAWIDSSGDNYEIYYAYWDGASWTTHGGANTGGGVSNNAGSSYSPSLALDSSNNPHIAWVDSSGGNREIYYAYWNGSGWVTHGGGNSGGGVSNNAGSSAFPSLALDSSGRPHIAWIDSSGGDLEIYYAYWNGSGWVTHGGANTGGGLSNNAGNSYWPSLALDSSNNPHIAWEDYSGGDAEIYYAYWDSASWTTHGGANTGGGVSNNAGSSEYPSLALDSSNNPHIAWRDYSGSDAEIYYAYWDSASWTTHGGANTGGGLSNNAGDSYVPSLALDSSNNPHIAWDDYPGGNTEIYYRYWDGASWTTHGGANTGGGVSNNAGSSEYPSLALDSSGNPHIAWWDRSGGWEIYYRYWNPGVTPSPTAAFSCNPEQGEAPLTVHFTNNSTGDIDTCEWDFGDGTSIVIGCEDPEHTYPDEGTYIVTLTVTGPGGTDTAECTIEVTGQPAQLEKPQAKHVVIIDIDGLRYDTLANNINDLPTTFRDLIGENFGKAINVKKCLVGLPSVTFTGQASLFTGCYARKHNIVGNQYFRRDKKEVRNYYGAVKYIFTWKGKQNGDLGDVKTIYEVAAAQKNYNYRSVIVFNQFVGRKSNKRIKWIVPDFADVSKYFCPEDVLEYDAKMLERAINEVQQNGLPNILTLYFAGLDHKSHCLGIDEQKEYLLWIGGLMGVFIKNVWGDPPNIPSDIVFVITSDHGHSPVSNDDLSMIEVSELAEKLKIYDTRLKIWKVDDDDIDDTNVLIAVNGGMLHIYVRKDLSTKRKPKWKELPNLNTDTLPVAGAIVSAQNSLGNFILQRKGEPLVLVKNTILGSYMVYKTSTKALITLNDAITEGLLSQEEVEKINSLYSYYSGDIILFANYDDESNGGHDFTEPSIVYCGAFSPNCPQSVFYLSSDHGNINLNDRQIPFVICGKGVKPSVVAEANQVDIAPTVADILGFEMPGVDGTSIFQK